MPTNRIVLAEYFTTEDVTLLFGVRTDWEEPKVVEIEADLNKLRGFATRHFGRQQVEEGEVPTSTRDKLLALDHDEWQAWMAPFIKPILSWADPDDYLYLVPHDVLHYLPLHAVQVDSQYLIERNPVLYTPSASVLKYCQAKRKGQRRSAFILADSLAEAPVVFARDQALAMAELFDQTELHVGTGATRTRLVEALDARREEIDVLHFAVHGTFNPSQALQSGLRLADEPLTAEAIFGLEMRADLVTLSACESGVNERRPGDELIGLTRALIYAGTPSVVVSLWTVDELSTSILMRKFYQELLQPDVTKVEALQRAQLHLKSLTAAEALIYAGEARARLEGDERAAAYLNLTTAEIRLVAHDFAAAQADYEALLTHSDLDDGVEHQAQAGIEKARLGARADIQPDYDRCLYDNLYHWAPFVLVGDWK